jgi:hypothetical protein
MSKFFKRIGRVLWLALRPVQHWSDTLQAIGTLIGIFLPTVLAVIFQLFGAYKWTLEDGIWASLAVLILALLCSGD